MLTEEETRFWGHQVFRYGELLHEGSNPIPDEFRDQATEIRWIEQDPSAQTEGENNE